MDQCRSDNGDPRIERAAFAGMTLPLSSQDLVACGMRSIGAKMVLTIALIDAAANHCIQITISVCGRFEAL